MEPTRNRVMEGMQQWHQREKNIAGLFSEDTLKGKQFRKVKLDYMRELHRNTRKETSLDEKMLRSVLKGEMKQLEKQLYPNRMERVLRRIGRSVKRTLSPASNNAVADNTGWMKNAAPARQEVKDIVKDKGMRPEQLYNKITKRPDLSAKKGLGKSKGLKV